MTDQQVSRPETDSDVSQPANDAWRKEIHSRIAGYRTRRGRRIEGAFSMRFPFPPAEATEPGTEALLDCAVQTTRHADIAAPAPIAPPELDISESINQPVPVTAAQAEATAEPFGAEFLAATEETRPQPVSVPRPRPKRKVIAFPRQATQVPEVGYRLADPVLPEQPRILDVPEELEAFPTTPLLDGLQFPLAAKQVPAPPADHIELPFQAVRLSQRIYAAFVDCAIVAAAAVVFGSVGYKMLPKLVLTKPLLLAAATLAGLLWAGYQYLFLLYSGTTTGMRMAKIRLRSFDGTRPSWRQRRSRVIGLYFSTASLLMGLVWALVDVDALCWHDRISHTYLTDRE